MEKNGNFDPRHETDTRRPVRLRNSRSHPLLLCRSVFARHSLRNDVGAILHGSPLSCSAPVVVSECTNCQRAAVRTPPLLSFISAHTKDNSGAELSRAETSWGRVVLGPSFLGAELTRGRDVHGPRCLGAELVWCRVDCHPAHLVEKTHQIVPFQTPQNLFGASRCGCLSKICQSATLCLKCPTLLPSEISWSEPRNDLCPAEFRSLFQSRNAEWLLRLSAVSATSSRRLLLSNFAMPLRKPRNVSECPLYGS